ncbi:MAG: ABC transporter permease [Acidobacteriaceae bacterium]|nr:ABC transporter permease [Acidobacteriaceae bacterium]
MWSLRQTWHFAIRVLQHSREDRELDEEIRSYTQLLADEKISQGVPEHQARRTARMEIGGAEQIKESVRERRTGAPLHNFLQDVRYAARMLRKQPGFAAVAVATLALGIGANTAIFSVVDATLLTPLPIPSPDRVAMVWTENEARGLHNFPASVPDYRDWKASGIFQYLAAFRSDGVNLRTGDRSERTEGLFVTPEWFSILGAKATFGRTFNSQEAQPGHANVVVLGWNLWSTRYHSDPSAIGTSLVIDGSPHIIMGVLPKDVPRFEHEEVYVPALFDTLTAQSRGSRSWEVVGRLAPGLGFAAAQQKMNVLNRRVATEYPKEDHGQTIRLQHVEDAFVQDVRALLLIVFGAVGFVLLVACANIANLLLARGTRRRKEIAIRFALGASRSRVFSQLLSESVLLAVLGAAAGIAPAFLGIRVIPKLGAELPNTQVIALNGPVLLFAFGLALASALFFGFLPALQFRNAETNQPLRETERGQMSRHQNRLGNFFVIGEVAFTMILIAGAGLMVRSLLQMRNHPPGYESRGVLKMDIALTGPEYRDIQNQRRFLDAVLSQFDRLPGIQHAAATEAVPGGDDLHGSGLHFTDRPEPRPEDVPIVLRAAVSPDYFQTMGIPLRQGRLFSHADTAQAQPVAIIEDVVAKKYSPNQNPVGKVIKLELNGPARTVVGVVGAVEQNPAVKVAIGEPGEVYLALAQFPRPGLSLVVRSNVDPAAIIPAIRKTIANIDPDVPLYKIRTLEEVRAEGRAPARFGAILLALFGVVALLLASIGVFGVVSYTVGQRLREFGIRLALGASTYDVLKLTLFQGAFLVGTGTLLGLLGAAVLTRMMRSVLTDVAPNDPLTFAAATLVLILVGLLASYMPARRAARVDPTIALRSE